jgi:WD repeat-containing protein 19
MTCRSKANALLYAHESFQHFSKIECCPFGSMKLSFRVDPGDVGPGTAPLVQWSRDSRLLACAGSNNQVLVFDRTGASVAAFPVVSPSLIDWDFDGRVVAVASSASAEISFFNLQQHEGSVVDAPFPPTWMAFSRSGSFLVAGSENGRFWIHDRTLQQAQTYQGTHCDRITDGTWNPKRQFALCSDDHSISVNNLKGEVVARCECEDTPCNPDFVNLNNEMILVFSEQNRPVLYVWRFTRGEGLTPISFSRDLGKIVRSLVIRSKQYVYVQFSTGKFVLVGLDGRVILERQLFTTVSCRCCILQNKAAVCAANSMKVISIADPKNITDEQVRFPPDAGTDIGNVVMSTDGQVAAISFGIGVVLVYLIEIPLLAASRGGISVYSESLSSLVIYDMHRRKMKKLTIEVQPQELAICQSKVAVSFNNQCWFYNTSDCTLISRIESSSSIDSLQVSDSAYAVLMNGTVMLNYFDSSIPSFCFPQADDPDGPKVTAFTLTEFLLIMATDDGVLWKYNTRTQDLSECYRHGYPIFSIAPNLSETRLAFTDGQADVLLLNPIKGTVQAVTKNREALDGIEIFFDILDRNVLAVVGPKIAVLFHFTDLDVNGPQLSCLCSMALPALKAALGLSNGSLIYLDAQLAEQIAVMPSHASIDQSTEEAVTQLFQLHRHRRALQIAIELKDKKLIQRVGESTLASLSVELASEAFSLCGFASLYSILNPMRNEEEYSFLRGYVSMMENDFNSAQKNFLESTRPEMALEMRAALLQFDYALKLAETYDPSQIPKLSHDSARQNELIGNYSLALKQYKDSLKTKEFMRSSRDGIVRCLILSGKVEQGMQQLAKTKDTKLILECARILERLAAFSQAAELFCRIDEWNLGAQCYLRANDLKSAGGLVGKVSDTKVLRSIGLQIERAGQLEPAVVAFERGNDWESNVRVLLKINLDRAAAVARDHPMVGVCRLVAEHCIQLGNFRYAIEFLVRAGRSDDAFRIAEVHNKMDELAELIGDNGTPEQYEAIGNYFCTRNQMIQAAKFFTLGQDPARALNCYMSDGSDPAMDLAIDLAERVPDRELREQLLEYLTVNMTQGRDIRYLMRMFIIMKQFEEAAITATRIADEFRTHGEYKAARDLLFDVMKQLLKHSVPVSSEMRQNLMLLHSYLLIKVQREKNRIVAALLLRRLSKFVSKFPAHASNLLVMAVVECSRCGMKKSAFEIATKLLQPEFIDTMKPDMKSKIQTTVRRKDTSEVEEEKAPCPVCAAELPISELYCPKCKSNLPFDAFSGMHMRRDDWCECPSCKSPASFTIMQTEKKCAMCGFDVENPQTIVNPHVV